MLNKSIKELATSLKNKEFSSTELTTYFLDRIKRYDDKLNSFITVTAELALTQAKHADKLLASNSNNTNNNPLLGIPIAQKDIFCTKGIKTSCASKMLDNFISPYNATIIDKLNNAGSVMLGKTNMDEFAMGSSNENSFYGACYNPWDLERVPGGSSGGSAAAVAARIAPIATGTDTGGSVRQPAALCGITGIKPTYGRVSRYGMIAFASSLDCYRCENPKDLGDLYKRSRSEGFGAEVKKRILTGTYVLSAGYYDAYYIKAQKIRKMIADDFKSALNDVDVILGPTSPNTAFKVGEKADNPISMYLNDIYTSSVNLAGLPGMSIPAGFVNNLPVGIQLIGNYLQEAKILNVAHKYQQATNWHKAMPENFNK